MQNPLKAATAKCKACIVYSNPARNYQYLVQYKSQISTISQKQFNKTYAKHFSQFAKFPTMQKRIARALAQDLYNQYASTNQI